MDAQELQQGNGRTMQVTRQSRRRFPETRRRGKTNGDVRGAPWHSSETTISEKDGVTSFLGWFSIGLGLAEVLAPQSVARLIGVHEKRHTKLLRAYGVRELAAGVAILARPKPTYWMWNRVIGDAVDLGTLGRAMRADDVDTRRLRMAMLAVAGVTALDIAKSVRLTSEKLPAAGHDEGSYAAPLYEEGALHLRAVVTVNKPVEEVFAFWKDARNFALFMDHFASVHPTTGGRSHWKVRGPTGFWVEWDADVVEEKENEMIRWQSLENWNVQNSGTVRFTPASGDRGTVVTLEVEYAPKAGAIGGRVGKLFATIPRTQLGNDLRRFKQLMEIGEVVRSDATAVPGLTHPAQPPKPEEMEDAR